MLLKISRQAEKNYLRFHVPVVSEPFSGQKISVWDVGLQVLHRRHARGARVKIVAAAVRHLVSLK